MYNNGITKTLIGSGPIYIANKSDGGKLTYIGDFAKFEISHTVETKELLSGRAGKGAKLKSLSRLKDVKGKFSLNEISVGGLEIGLRADVDPIAAGTVADEVITDVGIGCLARFAYNHDKTVAPVVKNSAGDVTYVKGTDYDLESVGIVPKSGGAIVEDQSIKVSYTKSAGARISALINSGKEYELVFCGVNEAESDKKFTVRIPRLTFTPASTVSFMGSDFANLELEGDILADPNETALYYIDPED